MSDYRAQLALLLAADERDGEVVRTATGFAAGLTVYVAKEKGAR